MTPLLGSPYVRPVTVGYMDDVDFETVKMEAQPFRPIGKSYERFVRKRTLVKYQFQIEVIKVMLLFHTLKNR